MLGLQNGGLFRDPGVPWREGHPISAWRCWVEEGSWGIRGPGFPSTPGSRRRLQEAGRPGLSPRVSVGAARGPFGHPWGPCPISLQGALPSGGAFIYTQDPKPSSLRLRSQHSGCWRKGGVIGEGGGAQGQVRGPCWEPASPQGGCPSGPRGGISSEDGQGCCVYKGTGGMPPTNPEPACCVCAGPPLSQRASRMALRGRRLAPGAMAPAPDTSPWPPGSAPDCQAQLDALSSLPAGASLSPGPRVQPPQGAPDSAQFQASFGETFAHSLQAALAPLSSPQRWRTAVCCRPWSAAAGTGRAGSAHCPSRVRESLAELCPPVPGTDPSSHGQSTRPGTDLAASRVLGAGASAISAHGRILQPPDRAGGPRWPEAQSPACLPACRPLEYARAKLHMLEAFLLGFVDEERGIRGEKGPAHGHTAGTRSRRDWNQGLVSATPLKSASPRLGPAPPPIGRRALQCQ